jgi:hypothetical protein
MNDPCQLTGQPGPRTSARPADFVDHIGMRIDLLDTHSNAWANTIIIERFSVDPAEPRVLEGDVIGVKGTFTGLTSYEAIFGQTITLPHVTADEIYTWSQNDRKWTKNQKAE